MTLENRKKWAKQFKETGKPKEFKVYYEEFKSELEDKPKVKPKKVIK